MNMPEPGPHTCWAFQWAKQTAQEMVQFALRNSMNELHRKKTVAKGFSNLYDGMTALMPDIDEPWRAEFETQAASYRDIAQKLINEILVDELMLQDPVSNARH